MSPAQFAIQNKVISWMLVLIFGVGGMAAFFSLGQLEDPPFTIKEARIIVGYPGASAQQASRLRSGTRQNSSPGRSPASWQGITCPVGSTTTYRTWSHSQ